MKVAYIEWRDSVGLCNQVWCTQDEVAVHIMPTIIRSIGFIVGRKKGKRGHVIISSSLTDNNGRHSPLLIPREAIIKLRYLKEA